MNRYGHGHDLKVLDRFLKVLKLKLIQIKFEKNFIRPRGAVRRSRSSDKFKEDYFTVKVTWREK